MTLRISGKNMDVGESLRATAEARLSGAVDKYFDGGFQGHVILEHEGAGYRCDGSIHLDTGVVLQASATNSDATAAFEQVAERIEKRLRRYKRKLKNHRRNASESNAQAQSYVLAAPGDDEEVAEDFSPAVIAESSQSFPTLSVGEAVMEMELADSVILAFRNAGHGGVNVVYRRPDGNIGWIDPALAADNS